MYYYFITHDYKYIFILSLIFLLYYYFITHDYKYIFILIYFNFLLGLTFFLIFININLYKLIQFLFIKIYNIFIIL